MSEMLCGYVVVGSYILLDSAVFRYAANYSEMDSLCALMKF